MATNVTYIELLKYSFWFRWLMRYTKYKKLSVICQSNRIILCSGSLFIVETCFNIATFILAFRFYGYTEYVYLHYYNCVLQAKKVFQSGLSIFFLVMHIIFHMCYYFNP